MPKTIHLTEAAALTASPAGAMTGRRFMARLIEADVQGSCGFYPASTLTEAANSKVFGAETPVYIDHPGVAESFDRPERSVRDLAGRLVTDAVMRPDGLYAEIEVWPHVAPAIEAMADAIGMSIRAMGTAEQGALPDGTQGVTITSLSNASSVDFVTRAGAGGKLVSLMESARTVVEDAFTPTASLLRLVESRNVGQWIESRMHLDFTTQADDMFGQGRLSREERIAMSGAVGAALDAFTGSLEASAPQLYERDLWAEPEQIAATIEAAMTEALPPAFVTDKAKCAMCDHPGAKHADMGKKPNSGPCGMPGCDCKAMKMPAAKEAATNVPAGPAGQEGREKTMPQIEVDEATYGRMTEAAARVTALEAERATETTALTTMTAERDAAVAESGTLREAANSQARVRVIREAADAAGVTLDQYQIVGLSVDAPMADGLVDEAALRTRADTALAALSEAAGAGTVTGFGHTAPPSTELTEAQRDGIYAAAFNRPATAVKGA